MKDRLASEGYDVDVVAVNVIGGQGTQGLLVARCSFPLLQDDPEVEVWRLLGGGKDDFFIYQEGGRLASYLPVRGELSTNLGTPEGWDNVWNVIVAADDLGRAAEPCGEAPAGGLRRPGDANGDSRFDISDPIFLLYWLFRGSAGPLPCGEPPRPGTGSHRLLDINGDGSIDISDSVHGLMYLFSGGPPPAGGTDCMEVAGCPDACSA